ncbi:MAG: hypothetical protein KTR31_31435 [Myxococcales bacterium]|nr:hypothetical protein [Myxococcales bacterium]
MTRIGWVVLALAGCGSVTGTVDGQPVSGARDALFDRLTLELPFLGRLEATVVMVTDFDASCEVLDGFLSPDLRTCDDLCEDYLQLADTYGFPDDEAWALTFVVNTSDSDTAFALDSDLAAGDFTAAFRRWDATGLADAAACEAACEAGELLPSDGEDAQTGQLELTTSSDTLVEGSFDLGLGGADEISGRFEATPCDLTDWILPE